MVSTNVQKLIDRYNNERIRCCLLSELEETRNKYGDVDVIIHTAFSRSADAAQIASSLEYGERVLRIAKKMSVKAYINVSSQGVYGGVENSPWSEQSKVAPDSLYAMAKYSTEKMTKLALQGTDINWTNIRLSSVCENARFVCVFVKNMIAGIPIKIIGGKQMLSFIDVRDAANALYLVAEMGKRVKYKEVYNLGTGIQTSIVEIANLVNKIGHEEYSLPLTTISTESKDIHLNVCMNNELFKTDFNWKPLYDLTDMIRYLFEFNMIG